ncbi:MAG: hypothetical protein V4726_14655 [Verrucomicrobiota bacterium]
MNTPRGSLSRTNQVVKKTDGGMFWWTIGISVLIGMATFSWIFSIFVFTHPETPFNYGFLEKMHRLDEIRQFDEKSVPSGKSYSPKDLYQKFYTLSDRNLKDNNSILRRNYITNYKNKDEKPFYISGRFRVVQARPLTKDDVFTTGMVARAVAINEDDREYRNVVVEYVLPTIADAKPEQQFSAGDILDIDSRRKKRRLYSSVINVKRINEDVMVFTVIPLLYGDHTVDAAKGITLTAAPPARLNLKAPLPITDSGSGAGLADLSPAADRERETPLPLTSVAAAK